MTVLDEFYALELAYATQRQKQISKNSPLIPTIWHAEGDMPDIFNARAYLP